MFSILRQAASKRVEERIAAQYAMTRDVPIVTVPFDALDGCANALREGLTLPIGSVEFVRKAMTLAGIAEPESMSYPEALQPWLHREVKQRRAGSILGEWFIKPTTTKTFTGFVVDILGNPDHLSFHDRAQYNAFLALPPDTPVWVSEPVKWQSEYRYYVVNGQVLGEGRYDDAPDDMPLPDQDVVREMVAAMANSSRTPVAYGLDVGVLGSGETALIECNDAWALGYYRGTLDYRDYVEMLWLRWEQLVADARAVVEGAGCTKEAV
ncbi:ATP-grasp domain-containing protein [Ralstonia sp. ASV6]|uniref:ATP-grasp domain-containing protein n=1 Tax=Ralstonia sp. ASV6 TaxID=2795124 RepID=UPI0018EC21AD|nr:ATP-grasp domain-containing protein [Ralstonia sp. ASV6]